jgi:sugar/nucleoside kinase (ribokinase family)
MSLVVVGSIAFDAVKTPFGERERMLGGSAVHFSLAASFFTEVRVVGPVGDDFGPDQYAVLEGRGVNTDDIERVEGGQTFFWRGHYDYDLNTAHTDDTQLNVFGEFQPKLSDESKAADNLFLANIQPDLQREVREQCTGARFAGLDSMNLWIDIARDSLVQTIGGVDLVFLNDAEIRMLTEQPNLVRPSKASTAPPCSPRRATSPCRRFLWRTLPTRPEPATPSPAGSSAIWPRRTTGATTPCCAGR